MTNLQQSFLKALLFEEFFLIHKNLLCLSYAQLQLLYGDHHMIFNAFFNNNDLLRSVLIYFFKKTQHPEAVKFIVKKAAWVV